MVNYQQKDFYRVYDLVELVAALRSEGGCPWDREQTHESIRRNFIEEVYEAIEAIDLGDTDLLKEELGDVLLQVVFHALMEQEKGTFNIDDVADGVCKKLVLRHPHVFGDVQVSGTGDVLRNWDEIKKKEKHQKTVGDTLESVAHSLPSLIRAEKVLHKAAKAGYGKIDAAQAADAAKAALADAEKAPTEESIGTLLAAVVKMAEVADIDPEGALEKYTDTFIADVRAKDEAK
ncbi:MAG: nucleoside triphosphate pyrophosphohydrolase [Ruminococcaceae bacterium]|nr:nucleoside triphosphate pyrophosphohydrolase [Oscillospiraceae bacterium]